MARPKRKLHRRELRPFDITKLVRVDPGTELALYFQKLEDESHLVTAANEWIGEGWEIHSSQFPPDPLMVAAAILKDSYDREHPVDLEYGIHEQAVVCEICRRIIEHLTTGKGLVRL